MIESFSDGGGHCRGAAAGHERSCFLGNPKEQISFGSGHSDGRGSKVADAVEAMRKGAEDYLLKPLAVEHLEAVIHRALSTNPGRKRKRRLFPASPRFRSIVTQDRRLNEILDLCRKVAASKATVLIQGESGTGKGTLGPVSSPTKSQESRAFCGRELRFPAGNPSRKRIVRP